MKNTFFCLLVLCFCFFTSIVSYSQSGNYVVQLDGVDDYISVPEGLISNNLTVTIETWFRTTDSGVIFGFQNTSVGESASNYMPLIYIGVDGLLRGLFWAGSINPISSTVPYNDGLWHHVAMVGNNTAQYLFVDGQLIGSADGQINHVDMIYNQFGNGISSAYPAGNGGWFPFKGQLDEARIWSVARSESEIKQYMSLDVPPNTPGLLGYWKFDEVSGQTANDASGHNNNAVLVNGALFTVYSNVISNFVLQFDGVDDYLSVPDGLIDNNSVITVEVWFNTTSYGVLFGYQNSIFPELPSGYVPALYIGLDGKLRGEYWFGVVNPITSAEAFNDGNWHHAALVGNTNTQSLFVDGNLVGTKDGNINNTGMQVNQFGIGNTGLSGQDWPSVNPGWFGFQGQLDEARIWNIALDESQIRQNMNQVLSANTPGLVGYWRLNEGSGISTGDQSGNGNIANLVNGPVWINSTVATDVTQEPENTPVDYSLLQNYPNPFNPTTTIKYSIPVLTPSLSPGERVSEGQVRVVLKVYDMLGREVATLINEEQGPGSYTVNFNGIDLSSGVYIYRLKAGNFIAAAKMILTK